MAIISQEERNRLLLEIKREKSIFSRIRFCEHYLKESPQDIEVLAYTGYSICDTALPFNSGQRFLKGLEYLRRVLSDPVYGPEAKEYFVKGMFLSMERDSLDEKIKKCESVELIFPDKTVFSWLSALYAEKKEWGKASEYLLKYIEKGGEVHEYHAVALFEHGQEIRSIEELTVFQKKISETQRVDSYWILNAAVHLSEMESKKDISTEEISAALADLSIPYRMICQLLTQEHSEDTTEKFQREKVLLEKMLLTYYKKGFTKATQLKMDKLTQFEALVDTYDDIDGRLLLGDYHFEKREWDSAKNQYQSLHNKLVQEKGPSDFLNDVFFNKGRMAGLLFSYLKISAEISKEEYATNILNRVKGYTDETLCRFIINLHKARKEKVVLDQPKKRIAFFGFDPINVWWNQQMVAKEGGEFSEHNCLLSYLREEYTSIHNNNQPK